MDEKMRKNQYSIAVIAGDGIGKEVIPEGLRVLEAAGKKHGINFEFTDYPFSSVHFQQTVERSDFGRLGDLLRL